MVAIVRSNYVYQWRGTKSGPVTKRIAAAIPISVSARRLYTDTLAGQVLGSLADDDGG